MEPESTHSNGQPPLILHDDQPLDGSTTAFSFANGITMVEDSAPNQITETLLSSQSSTHSNSSYLGNNNLSTLSSISTTASRRNSMQSMKHIEVRENLNASVTQDDEGNRQLEQYVIKREIGKGAFGKVHLAVDINTQVKYAIKEFSKSKLRKKDKANLFKLGPRGRGRGRGPKEPALADNADNGSPLDLIRGEIAILKKLHHVNIVKLYEVLDVKDEDSMYMVFEFCEKGVLMPVTLTTTFEDKFSDEQCRDYFHQIVLGIEYLHEHEIIHRDIKPDNLLVSGENIIKIVDFGVSEIFQKGDDKTKKTAGSPAFMAPELCRLNHGEVSGRATDIWSMGVTLYCLRYGRLPFVTNSLLDMQNIIQEQKFIIPDTERDERFKHLLNRILEKDPKERITIDELRADPWLTNDGRDPLISKEENTVNVVTELTEADINGAIKSCGSLATVIKAVTKFKRGIKSHSRTPSISTPETPSERISESERVQDADEGAPNQSNGDKRPEDTLETSVRKISLEVPTDSTAVLESKELEPKQEVSKPAEENVVEGEPSGYQICDMESGLCYWVPASKPASKIDTSEPAESSEPQSTSNTNGMSEVASQEEEKKEIVPEPVAKVQINIEPETEPEPKIIVESDSSSQDGCYQVCDINSGLCHWVPGSKDPSKSVSTPVESTESNVTDKTPEPAVEKVQTVPAILEAPTTPSREPITSRPLSPKPESLSSSHERTVSESSSPGRLNTAPRLVGKLSADRFAMFEKK
ncbi:hypothetical protein BGZ76_002851 [Entomortierella beljakovae]|nr:hypothetical protein BGZ76_002851 [Entomortierella beljakovae]